MHEPKHDEWEQLPAEIREILLAQQKKEQEIADMQAKLRAAQHDSAVSEDELNAMKVQLKRTVTAEPKEQPEAFAVGGESAESIQAMQMFNRSAVIGAAACIGYVVTHRRGWFLLGLIAAAVIYMQIERRRKQTRIPLLVQEDSLHCGSRAWQRSEITEIRRGLFGAVRIYAGEEKICAFYGDENNVERLLKYALKAGITVKGYDAS